MARVQTQAVKIYAAFLTEGHPVGYDAYRKLHPHIPVMGNEEVRQAIAEELPEVEFVGGTERQSVEEVVSNVGKQKQDIDGILLFGVPSPELMALGLPIVAVQRPLEGCTTVPFQAYADSKVLTASLPAHRDKDPKVYAGRISDIARKLRVVSTLAKMHKLRVLVVTDKPVLGYFEPMDLQIRTSREEYEQVYLENMKNALGTEYEAVPQEDLVRKMGTVSEDEAKDIANKWIAEAMMLRGTDETQIIASAKLYLGMKELMDEHNCGAITTEGYGWPPLGYDALPCQGMASTQLCTEGIVAASETLTDCLLTQQLGYYISGSAGLLGDYNLDPFTDTVLIAHCEGTLQPYADQPRSPYIIRNLPFVAENTGGACVQTNYPIGRPVTVAKIGTYDKKLSVFTGETVSGDELFPYWEDILGRNKVALTSDVEALLTNVDWEAFGNHRTVFFGEYRQDFIDLGKLIGFEVVEKDRLK